MPQEWEELHAVFSRLQDGTLPENILQFSDDQLRPFLPILISSTFLSGQAAKNDTITARLTGFTESNRIVKLLQTDFGEMVADLASQRPLTPAWIGASDIYKIELLMNAFLYEYANSPWESFFTQEQFDEAMQLFQIAYLKMPFYFNVERLVQKALTFSDGYRIVTGVISNAPELLEPVIEVVKHIEISDECRKGLFRSSLLDLLFCLDPRIVWTTVEELAQSRRDGLLAVRLACVHLSSDQQVISFLTSQLIHRHSDTVPSQLIAKSMARTTQNAIYERVIMRIGKAAIKQNNPAALTNILRLIVFLQTHCVAKLSPDYLHIFVSLLCKSIGDDSHLILTLAIIMSIQSFTLVHQGGMLGTVDERILGHFRYIRQQVYKGERGSLTRSVVYIASCVYSGKRDQLNAMFSELLRFKVTIQPRHLDAIATIMQEHCLKSEEVAQLSLQLPVTTNLNAESGSRLPINSVYLCFIKHGVDIAPWLEAQIRSCSLPIHNLLPELIERFAMMATRSNLPGLTKQFVEESLSGEVLDEKTIPIRVLTLLFLLSYRSNLDQLGSKAFEIHGPEVFTKLPAKYLLSVVMRRTKDFSPIQAPLIRLATDICPYMLPTVSSVESVAKAVPKTIALTNSVEELLGRIEKPGEVNKIVRWLQLAPLSDQVRCIKAVIRAYMLTLDVKCSKQLIIALMSVYSNLENFVPRMLFELAAIEWLGGHQAAVLLSDIYEHPALLFRCDRRIFSSPLHFVGFISALNFFMQASLNNLQRKIHAANLTAKNEQEVKEKHELLIAFDNAQVSMIVQLLIEVSDERRMKDDLQNEAMMIRRREVRKIACDFLHQIFVNDPLAIRVVLFQGLPLHMIPHLVEEVPSMFAAVDHIQEMMCQPDTRRRICAIHMMVNLSRKYRIKNSFTMIELILDVLNTLVKYSESFMNLRLFIKTVPVLAELITIFPQIAADVTALLLRVASMATSRLALQPLVIRPNCDERKLVNMVRETITNQIEAQN